MLCSGWTNSWVDNILDTVRKGKLVTTEAKAAAALDAIKYLPFSEREVENICHKAPDVLGCEAADIRGVIDYMKATGASDEEVKKTILKNPRALAYKVSGFGSRERTDAMLIGYWSLIGFRKDQIPMKIALVSPKIRGQDREQKQRAKIQTVDEGGRQVLTGGGGGGGGGACRSPLCLLYV
eukprot:scaffold144129_cov19-Prasinocladus_malaysianus.AAC.1